MTTSEQGIVTTTVSVRNYAKLGSRVGSEDRLSVYEAFQYECNPGSVVLLTGLLMGDGDACYEPIGALLLNIHLICSS